MSVRMYTVTLLVHSYLRWLVLVAGVVVIVRSLRGWLSGRSFVSADNRAQVAFMSVLDLQLLLGLLLYVVLSPVTQEFFAHPKASMKIAQVRFFGVEHLTMMIIGIAIVHIGRARGKKNPDARARHRATALTTIVWLLLTLVSIPWPGLVWGRPLFR